MERTAPLMLALVLACGLQHALGRIVVLQQDHTANIPGVQSRTFYVVSEGEEPETLATVDTWEASTNDVGGPWGGPGPFSLLSGNPFGWLRSQLHAVEMLQRAALFSWLLPQNPPFAGGISDSELSQQQNPTQEELLHRLGCSRFRAAMAEYARQSMNSRSAVMGMSHDSTSYEDDRSSVEYRHGHSSAASQQSLQEAAVYGWNALARGSRQQVRGISSRESGLSVSDITSYVEYEEYYADYDGEGGDDLAYDDEVVDDVAEDMAESIVRLLERDTYNVGEEQLWFDTHGDVEDVPDAYADDDEGDYEEEEETGELLEDGDYEYGEVLGLADAVLSELELEYFGDVEDYGLDGEELDQAQLEAEWADYLQESVYEYYDDEDASYDVYGEDEEDAFMRSQGLGSISELIAWTQTGDLVLHLWPRAASVRASERGDAAGGEAFLLGQPFVPVSYAPQVTVTHDLDWALTRSDGSINWGLVTLWLLVGGTVAMLVGFVASWLSLRRTMRRGRCIYIPAAYMICPARAYGGKGDLAMPLLDEEDMIAGGKACGKGAGVEYASQYVESGKGESLAKALYK